MSAHIEIAPNRIQSIDFKQLSVELDNDGYYWWLYSYFEAAKLPARRAELIDLYGDSEIAGYELERFRRALEEARLDATHRPQEWRVVIGWKGGHVSAETEIISMVRKAEMLNIIEKLLRLVTTGLQNNLPIVCLGD